MESEVQNNKTRLKTRLKTQQGSVGSISVAELGATQALLRSGSHICCMHLHVHVSQRGDPDLQHERAGAGDQERYKGCEVS